MYIYVSKHAMPTFLCISRLNHGHIHHVESMVETSVKISFKLETTEYSIIKRNNYLKDYNNSFFIAYIDRLSVLPRLKYSMFASKYSTVLL